MLRQDAQKKSDWTESSALHAHASVKRATRDHSSMLHFAVFSALTRSCLCVRVLHLRRTYACGSMVECLPLLEELLVFTFASFVAIVVVVAIALLCNS